MSGTQPRQGLAGYRHAIAEQIRAGKPFGGNGKMNGQRQLRPGRAETVDRPRPLEFDANGFPVPQRIPSFVTRVAQLRRPT
jgi:hypothetical protein